MNIKHYTAAWDLAYLYQRGKDGVEVNEKLAFKWMLLGAEHFNKHAQLRVSIMYLDGYGTEVDEAESTMWLISRLSTDPFLKKTPNGFTRKLKAS